MARCPGIPAMKDEHIQPKLCDLPPSKKTTNHQVTLIVGEVAIGTWIFLGGETTHTHNGFQQNTLVVGPGKPVVHVTCCYNFFNFYIHGPFKMGN